MLNIANEVGPNRMVAKTALRHLGNRILFAPTLFNDTVKARYLDKELSNRYVPRGNRRKVRAQMAIYDYLKSLEQPD